MIARVLLLVLSLGLLASCTYETPTGQCVGLDDERDPRLEYEISTRNALVGVLFVETLLVPGFVLLENLYCPTGKAKGRP